MRHRPQALTRAVAASGVGRVVPSLSGLRGLAGLRALGGWWRQPLRYVITVSHAGQSRAVEMDTRAAARVARRFVRRDDGAIDYAFAPGTHAYVIQRGNPARFTEPHRVSAFPADKPGLARLHVHGAGGAFAEGEGCRLYVQYHDNRQRLAAFSLNLRGPSQTTSFRAPPGASTASIALRLAGAGTLWPLAISYRNEPEAPGRATAAAAGPGEITDFDRMALIAAGAASRIAGVYDLGDIRYADRRFAIRPDQAVPITGAMPVCGLIFDDTIAPPFGWQGTFDENLYANLALIRILAQMERSGLPTVLLYDGRTETKPLFPEISALFAHQLRKGPEANARVAQILRLA